LTFETETHTQGYEIREWQKEFPMLKLDLVYVNGGDRDNAPYDDLTNLARSAWHEGAKSTTAGSMRTGMGNGNGEQTGTSAGAGAGAGASASASPGAGGAGAGAAASKSTVVLMGNGCSVGVGGGRDGGAGGGSGGSPDDGVAGRAAGGGAAASHAWGLFRLTGGILDSTESTGAAPAPTPVVGGCIGKYRNKKMGDETAAQLKNDALQKLMAGYEDAARVQQQQKGGGLMDASAGEGAAMYAMAEGLAVFQVNGGGWWSVAISQLASIYQLNELCIYQPNELCIN
jgi:hypothetical protein